MTSIVDFDDSTLSTIILPLGPGDNQKMSKLIKWKDDVSVAFIRYQNQVCGIFRELKEHMHTGKWERVSFIHRQCGSMRQVGYKRASSRLSEPPFVGPGEGLVVRDAPWAVSYFDWQTTVISAFGYCLYSPPRCI